MNFEGLVDNLEYSGGIMQQKRPVIEPGDIFGEGADGREWLNEASNEISDFLNLHLLDNSIHPSSPMMGLNIRAETLLVNAKYRGIGLFCLKFYTEIGVRTTKQFYSPEETGIVIAHFFLDTSNCEYCTVNIQTGF